MLFNTIDFAAFLSIVFVLYWFVTHKSLRLQNILIVLASYVFYGWWDWRFLGLILFSTIVDFLVGKQLSLTDVKAKRRLLLWTSVGVNIGLLGFFKYYNFFVDSFTDAFSLLGFKISASSLDIILPVGISFYTFQTLSYTIDVYRKKLPATNDFIAFSAFVSFFPQLVAGPIERASHLLPQFYTQRHFDYNQAVDGCRQILWGLFKKVVIADNCATVVNEIFANSADASGATLFVGALFFSFQIYGDFSGYSDIAIGVSRLFGFDLMQNFAFPYFSRDIAEFWRRWHISLSTWFRDYLYIPLGGSRGNLFNKLRNTLIIFIVSGFWHGANWTFIVWGALNALYFLPLLLMNRNRNNITVVAHDSILPSIKEVIQMTATFILVLVAWVFFRAENVGIAYSYVSHMLQDLGSYADLNVYSSHKTLFALLGLFVLIEWIGRSQRFAIQSLGLNWYRPLRYSFYYALIILIFWFGGEKQAFIYFQF